MRIETVEDQFDPLRFFSFITGSFLIRSVIAGIVSSVEITSLE